MDAYVVHFPKSALDRIRMGYMLSPSPIRWRNPFTPPAPAFMKSPTEVLGDFNFVQIRNKALIVAYMIVKTNFVNFFAGVKRS